MPSRNRKPTPRTQRKVPCLVHIILLAITFGMCLWGITKAIEWRRSADEVDEANEESAVVDKSMSSLAASYLNDGTRVCWYVFIDPEEGKQYLYNDLGGVTPRTSDDGQMEVNPNADEGFIERGL